ncbi:MAG: YqzL family protein [Alicyclobacillus sp.]|nr:YqzL family protein [Alicyclobacillus sp.]
MISVREFSWRYFTMTGDIQAYLLYKRHEELLQAEPREEAEAEPVQPDSVP